MWYCYVKPVIFSQLTRFSNLCFDQHVYFYSQLIKNSSYSSLQLKVQMVLQSSTAKKGYLVMDLFPNLSLKRIFLLSGLVIILFLVSNYNVSIAETIMCKMRISIAKDRRRPMYWWGTRILTG